MKIWREPKIVDLGVEDTKNSTGFLSDSDSNGSDVHSSCSGEGCSSSSCPYRES